MNNEVEEIDLDKRCAEVEGDDQLIAGIEVSFAIPIYLSMNQQRRLSDLLSEIINDLKNQPQEGVHWLGSVGGKMNLSRVDCSLLGLRPGPQPPEDGEEPECDGSILCFGSMARSFNSEKERIRELERRRKSEFTCPKCGGHAFGTHGVGEANPAARTRYCNGRGHRGRVVDGTFVPIEGPDEPLVHCDFTWPETDDAKYGLKPLR